MTVLYSRTRQEVFTLSEADKVRLERLALLFDIEFSRTDRCVQITIRGSGEQRTVCLDESVAHMRLLTELCSKCVNWVYFRGQEHCGKTLLALPDVKLLRIAELYALRRSTEEKTANPQ